LSKFIIFLIFDLKIFFITFLNLTALDQVLGFNFQNYLDNFSPEIARAEGSSTSARGIFDSDISVTFKAISIA